MPVSPARKTARAPVKWTPRPLVSKCGVCTSPATDVQHYGSIACFSCRAFFRRSVGGKKDYPNCSRGTDNCVLDPVNRTNCKKCRYSKCLQIGMIPDKVDKTTRKRDSQNKRNKLVTVTKQETSPRLNIEDLVDDCFKQEMEEKADTDNGISFSPVTDSKEPMVSLDRLTGLLKTSVRSPTASILGEKDCVPSILGDTGCVLSILGDTDCVPSTSGRVEQAPATDTAAENAVAAADIAANADETAGAATTIAGADTDAVTDSSLLRPHTLAKNNVITIKDNFAPTNESIPHTKDEGEWIFNETIKCVFEPDDVIIEMKDAVFDELTDGPVNKAGEQMEADTDNELLLHEIISQSLATLCTDDDVVDYCQQDFDSSPECPPIPQFIEPDMSFEEEFRIHELMVRKESITEEGFNLLAQHPRFKTAFKKFLTSVMKSEQIDITHELGNTFGGLRQCTFKANWCFQLFLKINGMFEDELMGVNIRTKAETLNFVIPILHLLQRAYAAANTDKGSFLGQHAAAGTLNNTLLSAYKEALGISDGNQMWVPSFNPLKLSIFQSPWASNRQDEILFFDTILEVGSLVKDDLKLGTLFYYLNLFSPKHDDSLTAHPQIQRVKKEINNLLFRYLKSKYKDVEVATNITNRFNRLLYALHECRDIHLNRRIFSQETRKWLPSFDILYGTFSIIESMRNGKKC